MVFALAAAFFRRFGVSAAAAVFVIAIIYYYGLTNIPWLGLVVLFTVMGYSVGGKRLALGVLGGLAFLLLTGIWDKAVLSLYIVSLAALLSFVIGSALGIWAAENDYVSAVLRPISDTLQTMPLFVIVIPFVMLFKIGEFLALLSIMVYAIVPAIRYSEYGMRNLSPEIIEAATSIGASRWQMLWQVKIPMAMPVILLGLNQTIMYAIAMLVIAALVGTNGLGQQVYIGLSDGDFGVGIVAGW
ncbi:MAG: ABC transporter permease subunit [Rhodobacteraceae bacterium]|nr:ABC transporter permease subunit [Paracoccaceae bacterium]